MHLPHYPIRIAESGHSYRFISSGPNGDIEKEVSFTEQDASGVYNLGFGDRVEDSDEIDDFAVSDNGDTQQVLSTVAIIAYDFLMEHPGAGVFATGSTPERTRLYQMAIARNFDWLNKTLHIFGYKDNRWETFRKGVRYKAFYVVRNT